MEKSKKKNIIKNKGAKLPKTMDRKVYSQKMKNKRK